MGVYKLSASGGLVGARTTYGSMLAGNSAFRAFLVDALVVAGGGGGGVAGAGAG